MMVNNWVLLIINSFLLLILLQDEIFDMVKPRDKSFITLQDLINRLIVPVPEIVYPLHSDYITVARVTLLSVY